MRPFARRGVESQKDVGRKQTAEEHYLRGEKQPDPDLGVPKAGIAARAYGVGNFHLFMPGGLVRVWDAP